MTTIFTIIAIYLAIGATIAIAAISRNRDMVDDMDAVELGKFLAFFALTWPSYFIGEEE